MQGIFLLYGIALVTLKTLQMIFLEKNLFREFILGFSTMFMNHQNTQLVLALSKNQF